MTALANHTTVDVIEFPDQPTKIGKNESQLIYGESFNIEREEGEYYYGTCTHDDYAGYVPKSNMLLLKDGQELPSYLIHVPSSHLYTEPTFKSRPILSLSYLSRLSITTEEENGFIKTKNGNWIFLSHIKKLRDFSNNLDTIETAKMFLGTPYLYAGRSIYGIDCSGLIQILAMAGGHSFPERDCCDQETTLGQEITLDQIQAGDIVYFKGHVGIMVDEKRILNATSRHMTTLIEDLDDLIKIYDGITHIRRLSQG